MGGSSSDHIFGGNMGVGKGSANQNGSEHVFLGVEKLIGPRFEEKYEKMLSKHQHLIVGLIFSQAILLAMIAALMLVK